MLFKSQFVYAAEGREEKNRSTIESTVKYTIQQGEKQQDSQNCFASFREESE